MSTAVPIDTSDVTDIMASQTVNDMTLAEISTALDGKIGLGMGRWGGIILLFLLSVAIAIVAFVVVWIVFSKQLNQESGARDINIVKVTGTGTKTEQITKTSYYIYSTSVNSSSPTSQAFTITVSRPDVNISGAPAVFVSSTVYNTTISTIVGNSLNISSSSDTDKSIKFVFLDGTSGSNFNVISIGVPNQSSTVSAGTYTTARIFIWTDDSTLTEVDASNGFTPLLLQQS